jgi:hypothetical protein
MTAVDEYLNQVRRSMAGMTRAVREDILRELQGHIAEVSAANGGNVTASLAALGPAREVGRRYRDLYGYGTAYKILFAAIAFVLAVPSIPVLFAGPDSLFPFNLSILFVIGAVAWVIWVSVAAGSRAGSLSGVAAMVGRLAAFGSSFAAQPSADVTAGGLVIVFAVAALFVLLGWIPGTAKRTWKGPRGEI